jgi:hypothetical protein
MADPTDIQKLVCHRCWQDYFSTDKYKLICTGSSQDEAVYYETTVNTVEQAAEQSCNWCSFLLSLWDWAELWDVCLDYDRPAASEDSELLDAKVGLSIMSSVSWLLPTVHPSGNNRFNIVTNGCGVDFMMFTERDDPAGVSITVSPLQYDIASSAAFSQARRWIENCSTHKECPSMVDCKLPTRVIDVGPDDSLGDCKLVLSGGMMGQYVALSYCWGPSQSGVTTQGKANARIIQLDVQSLPRTVQDAIFVTRRIGFRYLWVDAICIIQDSPSDVTQELKGMHDVYLKASVTISAASAASSSDEFLAQRPALQPALNVPFWSPDGSLELQTLNLKRITTKTMSRSTLVCGRFKRGCCRRGSSYMRVILCSIRANTTSSTGATR